MAIKRGYAFEHQLITQAGDVNFGLDTVKPKLLRVVGTDALVSLSATARYTVRDGRYVRFCRRPLDVTADGANRWLVHSPGKFIPRLALAGKVPGAAVWDWVAEPSPKRIDLGKLIKIDVEVLTADGGPCAAGIGILRGTRSVPLRWEQLLATNLSGRANVWLPPGEHLIYAATGKAHAYAIINGAQDGPLQLRLKKLPTMRVRVRDADGVVQGAKAVTASISTGTQAPREVAMFMSKSYAQLGRSDANGVLPIVLFALPGMEFELQIKHAGRESKAFPFVADSTVDVVVRE